MNLTRLTRSSATPASTAGSEAAVAHRPSGRRHRVVVIGAGFGGLAVARGLRDEAVDVTLIDANNFHTFQPLVYQVATAGLAADDVVHATRGLFHRQRNVDVVMARVTDIDIDGRVVHTTAGVPVGYDTLVVAVGAVSHDFGIPGVAANALELKTVDDAVTLRNRILERFESASADPASIDDGHLDLVICGGGPTGVELAGAFSELFSRVLAKDFPHLDVERSRTVLVEGSERLLGKFSAQSGDRARVALGKLGVEVVTGVKVERIEPDEVHLSNGTVLRAQTIVWTAGVHGHPLAATLGVPLSPDGRIVVGPDLSVPGHPEVFAIGDVGVDPASPLPQLALPALQGGEHTARQIGRRLNGRATEPFVFRDLGTMATIGRHDAVAEFPNGVRLGGVAGWLAWLGLHVARLMGFRNRANVLVNWIWNYLTYDRASRLLSERAAIVASGAGGPMEQWEGAGARTFERRHAPHSQRGARTRSSRAEDVVPNAPTASR